MNEGDLFQSSRAAASGMRAQAERLRLVAENIANADTPGYRRKVSSFEEVLSGGQQTGQVRPPSATGPTACRRAEMNTFACTCGMVLMQTAQKPPLRRPRTVDGPSLL